MTSRTRSVFLLLSFLLLGISFSGCQRTAPPAHKPLEAILTDFHDPTGRHILIAAHRAMHTRYPENSLAAIQDAIDHGIDIVEIDVRTTRDGKMVLMHDSDIERTTNGQGKVADLTWQQLQQYRLKTRRNDTAVYRIPTLREALTLARGKIMVDLDIKGAYVKPLVAMVQHTGTARQAIFFHSGTAVLDSVLLLDSTLLIMPRAHDTLELHKLLQRYDPPVVHIDDSFFTPDVVAAIRNDGARVWINALGTPDVLAKAGIKTGYEKLVKKGANILQTDHPALMNRYLTKKGWR